MISVIINADTRSGYLKSELGEGWGKVSLQGARSVDFLTEGIRQKIKFFNGYDIQCVLIIDKHEYISPELMEEIKSIVIPCGNNSQVIFKEHNRTDYKWNDKLYIESLKYAEGDYVCHIDQDCNTFKEDGYDVIKQYIEWLNNGYKYICQPWDGIGDEMFHASTRFFICKKETLDEAFKEDLLINPLRGKHSPCLEFALGYVAGMGTVLYPPRNDENYLVFSWATYCAGTLKALNQMPYKQVKERILSLGLHGPMDCIDKQINDD